MNSTEVSIKSEGAVKSENTQDSLLQIVTEACQKNPMIAYFSLEKIADNLHEAANCGDIPLSERKYAAQLVDFLKENKDKFEEPTDIYIKMGDFAAEIYAKIIPSKHFSFNSALNRVNKSILEHVVIDALDNSRIGTPYELLKIDDKMLPTRKEAYKLSEIINGAITPELELEFQQALELNITYFKDGISAESTFAFWNSLNPRTEAAKDHFNTAMTCLKDDIRKSEEKLKPNSRKMYNSRVALMEFLTESIRKIARKWRLRGLCEEVSDYIFKELHKLARPLAKFVSSEDSEKALWADGLLERCAKVRLRLFEDIPNDGSDNTPLYELCAFSES